MSAKHLVSAYQGQGMAQGGLAFGPERQAARAAARLRRDQSNEAIREIEATKPTEEDYEKQKQAEDQALTILTQNQKAQIRENNKRRTYDAFERYDNSDGDVRHINTMLRDLRENGSGLLGHISRVDKLTENDRELIENAGFHADDACASGL